jgi:alpha-1,2-rhamnosyltransferase
MRVNRILIDVTYTRTQERAVGITRTVYRLAEELSAIAPGLAASFAEVAFDGAGFRAVDSMSSGQRGPSVASGLFGFATRFAKPAIEQVLRLPWPWIRPVWEPASARAFRGRTAHLNPIRFTRGDLLLLFDASWNYPVWHAARKARHEGAAVVPLVHDLMPLTAPQFCVPWVRGAFDYWLRQMVDCSDAILCNSAATESAVRAHASHHGWSLPPTSHFRLGSDLEPPSSGTVRAALHALTVRPPGFYATVGSVEPKKNHSMLLDAFERAWASGQMLPLLVAGRWTAECGAVIERMKRLLAQGRPLILVPDANDAEIAFIYRHARALILPSLFEGFGLPLVEARTQGCQVLASDIASFRELADAGVRLFDPHAAEELAAMLVAHAQGKLALATAVMPAFSWNDSARQCLDRVRTLLSV